MSPVTRIDLHVVLILALIVPISLAILPIAWALVAMATLPQGLILTRAADLRRVGQPVKPHVILHEALLGFVVALCAAGWHLLHRV